MRSVTPSSLDYFVPHAPWTLSDDVKVTCSAFIWCMLAKVFTLTGYFIGAVLLYSVESVSAYKRFLFLQKICYAFQKAFELELSHTIRGSSLFIPSSYEISLRMGQRILEVISKISSFIALISYMLPSLGSPIVLLFIMMGFLIVSYIMIITVQLSVSSSFSITVDIGLEPSDSIDWSHLTPDLACGIVNRMTTFRNYIAAKGVNRDWRSAFSSTSPDQLPLPALLLSEPPLTDMRTLFSLYYNSHHRLQLSEVRGKRIWGSQLGWVVTLGPRYVTQLVHLMTGNRINLPQIQRLAPQEEWFCLIHKFTLLKDPTDESTFLVIAIFGPMNSLAFTRVREEGPALNRIGEGEWIVVANPENLKFKDVVSFNGQLYAVCDNGKLFCFGPDVSGTMVQFDADPPRYAGPNQKIYLVESLGNLYGVFRAGFLIPSEGFETRYFYVYKFNFNASPPYWEEVKRLEGQTFFVSDSNSFSWEFPTSMNPSRSNCIFFTDDHWVWRKFPKKAYGGHDVGLFNMEIEEILPLTFGKDKPCFYSRPIFVTRNDKLL